MPVQPKPIAERLWPKVDIRTADECWPFMGARLPKGYGRIGSPDGALLAHRAAYEDANGPIPEGMDILHSCDNPPCCNPAHLFTGTNLDNIEDKTLKGRCTHGDMHHNAKLNAAKVRRIREIGRSVSSYVLAEEFGVSAPLIQQVIACKIWNHVAPRVRRHHAV